MLWYTARIFPTSGSSLKRIIFCIQEHGFALHKGAFRDAFCLHYGWQPNLFGRYWRHLLPKHFFNLYATHLRRLQHHTTLSTRNTELHYKGMMVLSVSCIGSTPYDTYLYRMERLHWYMLLVKEICCVWRSS